MTEQRHEKAELGLSHRKGISLIVASLHKRFALVKIEYSKAAPQTNNWLCRCRPGDRKAPDVNRGTTLHGIAYFAAISRCFCCASAMSLPRTNLWQSTQLIVSRT